MNIKAFRIFVSNLDSIKCSILYAKLAIENWSIYHGICIETGNLPQSFKGANIHQ